jgi:hypothetical protein
MMGWVLLLLVISVLQVCTEFCAAGQDRSGGVAPHISFQWAQHSLHTWAAPAATAAWVTLYGQYGSLFRDTMGHSLARCGPGMPINLLFGPYAGTVAVQCLGADQSVYWGAGNRRRYC